MINLLLLLQQFAYTQLLAGSFKTFNDIQLVQNSLDGVLFEQTRHLHLFFEFASRISPQFKLYLIKEFQRLKDEERKQFGWDIRRNLTKINYRIHTDAIKENLIPTELSKSQISRIYAFEVDILNMALFGMTAAQWRDQNLDKKGK